MRAATWQHKLQNRHTYNYSSIRGNEHKAHTHMHMHSHIKLQKLCKTTPHSGLNVAVTDMNTVCIVGSCR